MFLFVIKISIYLNPGGKFFTPSFVVKLVIYPEFSNALSETLRTYTFLVIIVGQIKSVMLRVWKTNSRSTILGVPPRNSCYN